jgi:hypothetical protein
MTYRGTVKNGVVVFDGETPPEGTTVDVAETAAATPPINNENLTPEQRAHRLHQSLLELAKNAEQVLPMDASRNVDHYLYGHPKR